ncbi:hypothetical protein AALP_AA8G359600 [Arabis alpina]|uniref:Glabrous enhancer-binding protein-like C-terminal domain-containing protein n=1 Tax=Arabis alpina TaxID=50452 RepID=A0A087GBL3_ARAAL|nr:hypothetical protein AALP_AA8G359600 [Arabis alpina]
MAKENPEASDENELEIGVEDMQTDSEEESDDASDSESESDSMELEANREEDWFEKSYLVGEIAKFGVSEDVVKESWRMCPMETKQSLEEKWKALQAKEMEYMLLKAKLILDVTCLLAKARNP